MNKLKIVSDSLCDLHPDTLNKYGIDIVPCYVSMDGKNYLRENIDISREDFLEYLKTNNTFPKTATPSIEDYLSTFRKFTTEGYDVICICLTSKHSSLFQCAGIAKNMLIEEFPDARVSVVDSVQTSANLGLLLIEISKMKNNGVSYESILKKIEEIKRDGIVISSLGDFNYMVNSGRTKKADKLTGSILDMRAIIRFENGDNTIVAKVRGWNYSRLAILDLAKRFLEGKHKDNYSYAVVYSTSKDEAKKLEDLLKENLNIDLSIPVTGIGCTNLAHIGPKAIGLGIFRKL